MQQETGQIIVCYNPGSTSADYWAAEINTYQASGALLDKQTLAIPTDADAAVRQDALLRYIRDNAQFTAPAVRCIGVRGAILIGAKPGVTRVDQGVIDACAAGRFGTVHPCNNAPADGWAVANALGLADGIFFADPVSSEDPGYNQACKMSGIRELPIESHAHYLALREMVAAWAQELGIGADEVNGIFIYAGGGGFSIAAVRDGKIVAVSNPNQIGPPGITRCCDVPTLDFARWVFDQAKPEGSSFKLIEAMLLKKSGLMSHLGHLDVRNFEDIIQLARQGNSDVQGILNQWYFRIAEEIGKRLVSLDFQADVLVWAGKMTDASELTMGVYEHVRRLIPTNRVIAEDLEVRSLTRQVIQAYLGQVPVNLYVHKP